MRKRLKQEELYGLPPLSAGLHFLKINDWHQWEFNIAYRACTPPQPQYLELIDGDENKCVLARKIFYQHSGKTALWDCLLAYQVPFFEALRKGQWGFIDLLGLSRQEPIVIEILSGDISESPLRTVLEAAAYAQALKTHWALVRDEIIEYQQCIPVSEPPEAPMENPSKFHAFVLAPDAYWKQWTPGDSSCASRYWSEASDALPCLSRRPRELDLANIFLGAIRGQAIERHNPFG